MKLKLKMEKKKANNWMSQSQKTPINAIRTVMVMLNMMESAFKTISSAQNLCVKRSCKKKQMDCGYVVGSPDPYIALTRGMRSGPYS